MGDIENFNPYATSNATAGEIEGSLHSKTFENELKEASSKVARALTLIPYHFIRIHSLESPFNFGIDAILKSGESDVNPFVKPTNDLKADSFSTLPKEFIVLPSNYEVKVDKYGFGKIPLSDALAIIVPTMTKERLIGLGKKLKPKDSYSLTSLSDFAEFVEISAFQKR